MKKNLKFLLLMTSCSLLLGGVFAGYLVYRDQYLPYLKEKRVLEDFARIKVLEKGLSVLESWWKDGPPKVEKWKHSCPHTLGTSEKVDLSYYQCNPAAIECAIDNGVVPIVETDGRFHKMTLNKIFKSQSGQLRRYFPISKSTVSLFGAHHQGAIVELSLADDPKTILRVSLGDTCNSIYLPKRTYVLGDMDSKKQDWLWDNVSRNYYIDRFQVTNREVLDWVYFNNGPHTLVEKLKDKVLAAPATMLSKDQMEAYCLTYGKAVLTAHLFDAATFHPERYEETNKKYIYRSKYPEGGRNSEHFLDKIRTGKLKRASGRDCRRVYGLECFEKVDFLHHSRESTSWTGLFQVLGGYPEYLMNLIEPEKNLKASSFYLPLSSLYHQLGYRTFWDGLGGDLNNFQQGIFPPIDKAYEVAFRCFREVENE